jgi:hypothetical protein
MQHLLTEHPVCLIRVGALLLSPCFVHSVWRVLRPRTHVYFALGFWGMLAGKGIVQTVLFPSMAVLSVLCRNW